MTVKQLREMLALLGKAYDNKSVELVFIDKPDGVYGELTGNAVPKGDVMLFEARLHTP